jgi:hypothetical protein
VRKIGAVAALIMAVVNAGALIATRSLAGTDSAARSDCVSPFSVH